MTISRVKRTPTWAEKTTRRVAKVQEKNDASTGDKAVFALFAARAIGRHDEAAQEAFGNRPVFGEADTHDKAVVNAIWSLVNSRTQAHPDPAGDSWPSGQRMARALAGGDITTLLGFQRAEGMGTAAQDEAIQLVAHTALNYAGHVMPLGSEKPAATHSQ